MSLALLIFTIIVSLYSAIEITFPHHFQKLLQSLKSDTALEDYEPSKLDIFTSLLPLIHIPFIVLLFLSNTPLFLYFGSYYVLSFVFEGFLVKYAIKYREVITFKAILDLLIQAEIIRSLISMGL